MSYPNLEDDINILNTTYRKNKKPLKVTFPWLENDITVLNAVYTKNIKIIKKYRNKELHVRHIIKKLKNDPEYLDFFLEYFEDPGAGSYFFTKIKDNRTFDIYKKHCIYPGWNFRKSCVTDEQWEYIKKIQYIPKEYAEEIEEEYIKTGG